jgi:hypothetical protein
MFEAHHYRLTRKTLRNMLLLAQKTPVTNRKQWHLYILTAPHMQPEDLCYFSPHDTQSRSVDIKAPTFLLIVHVMDVQHVCAQRGCTHVYLWGMRMASQPRKSEMHLAVPSVVCRLSSRLTRGKVFYSCTWKYSISRAFLPP